jgi:hypothetical protein
VPGGSKGDDKRKVKSKLTCFFTNADQFPNKRVEFTSRLQSIKPPPDIIAITEVKPKNSRYELQPAEYAMEGYTAHPINLSSTDTHTRGILVWTTNELKCSPIKLGTEQDKFQEAGWIDISLGNEEHVIGMHIQESKFFRR